MTVAELRRKRAAAHAAAKALSDKAETENRALTPEEQAQFDTFMAEVEALKQRIANVEATLAGDDASTSDAPAEGASARHSRPPAGQTRSADPAPWHNPRHPYRLTRAIACVLEGRELDGVEGETTQELSRRHNKKPQGFYMPHDLRTERRAFDTTAGAGAIVTTLGTDFIELLRARSVLQMAGARILTDLSGNFGLPRQSGGGTASWVTEGAAPGAGTNATIDQVLFSPKTIAGYTDITRRTIKQSSVDVEAFIREDVAKMIALAIEHGAFNGSGTGAEPLGLLKNTSVTAISLGTDGGAPTFDALINLETTVADANADLGSLAYITNAVARGRLKRTLVDANVLGIRVWGATVNGQTVNDEVNGYPAYVTTQVPKNLTKGTGTGLSAMLFGNWADLVVGLWGPLDILVDPYTGSSSGTVRVNALQECDIKPRHAASFARIVDMQTN
jgi:HK97 family phage major capsid protein